MIIKIGNMALQPWAIDLSTGEWHRWIEYKSEDKIILKYENLGGRWYPHFRGSTYFLKPIFEEIGVFNNHKYKHHQMAMDQLDKFLIRMGKLTSFI